MGGRDRASTFRPVRACEFAGLRCERPGEAGGGHHPHEAFDQVVDIAETAGLAAVAVDGDVLAAQRLDDEVAHHPAVVRMHARAVGVEDADDLDVEVVLAVIVEEQGFGAAFALVVAAADADGIDPAPVAFRLRMHFRVAVDLAGGGLQDARLQPLGQTQHVDRTVHAGLGGLHRVVLEGTARPAARWIWSTRRTRNVTSDESEQIRWARGGRCCA